MDEQHRQPPGRTPAPVNGALICPASQIYRLVSSKPERVSLKLVAAICDVFSCGPEDLITVTAADARKKPIAAAAGAKVVDIDKSARPKRAKVIRDDD